MHGNNYLMILGGRKRSLPFILDILKCVYWKVITLYIGYIKGVYWMKMYLLTEKLSIEWKYCLLNKNVHIEWKYAYWRVIIIWVKIVYINLVTSSHSSVLETQESHEFSSKLLFIEPNKLVNLCHGENFVPIHYCT